jgi:uncharacterized membrane-anchored protein
MPLDPRPSVQPGLSLGGDAAPSSSSAIAARMNSSLKSAAVKVPALTLGFWVVKIAATTLGETAGDAATMSMQLGYAIGTAIFAAVFVAAVLAQIKARSFRPLLYWFTIVATTTAGTTLADLVDRSLGIGYLGGSTLLLACVLGTLALWYRTTGTVAVGAIASPRDEAFYWTTIMCSQTLGTALGDWTADDAGLGYAGSAMVFGGLLTVVAALYCFTRLSRTALFWLAFVLTRPLGAVVGDFLDKPVAQGGLELSRVGASAALVGVMITWMLISRQRSASRPH